MSSSLYAKFPGGLYIYNHIYYKIYTICRCACVCVWGVVSVCGLGETGSKDGCCCILFSSMGYRLPVIHDFCSYRPRVCWRFSWSSTSIIDQGSSLHFEPTELRPPSKLFCTWPQASIVSACRCIHLPSTRVFLFTPADVQH